MKNLILSSFILMAYSGYGQINESSVVKEDNWSVGVNALVFGLDFWSRPIFSAGSGVMVKRKYKPLTIRIGAEYFFKNFDKNDFWAFDVPSFDGRTNDVLLKLGLEKSLISFRFISLYGALDLFTSREYSDLDIRGGWRAENVNQKRLTYTVGIMPVLGLEFKLNDKFTLNTEMRVPLSNSYSKTRTTDFDSNITRVENYKQWSYYLDKGFASLSFNYKF